MRLALKHQNEFKLKLDVETWTESLMMVLESMESSKITAAFLSEVVDTMHLLIAEDLDALESFHTLVLLHSQVSPQSSVPEII